MKNSTSATRRLAWHVPLIRTGLISLLATCALLAAGAAQARDAGWQAGDQRGQLWSGGLERSYEMHVPAVPAPRGGFPLILAFHGGGGRGATMRRLTGFDAFADRRGFIVVYPDGVDRHWNDGRSTIKRPVNDVAFVSALLDRLERSYPIDGARVFATGLSNGALFTERLGCELSGRFAAIAPVAGPLPADIAPLCHPSRPVAFLQIAGTADPIMPYEGGAVADFGGRGEGGTVLSVRQTAAFWARRNGCARPGREQALRPALAFDPTRVTRTVYSGCPFAARVSLLTIDGGGHAWPGGPQFAPPRIIGRVSRQIDASRAIVDFFLSSTGSGPTR